MLTTLQVAKFLAGYEVLIDVRAPKEFKHGHIPRAVNIPLFNDEERHIIGKMYKEHGKPKAVEQGKVLRRFFHND